MRDKHTNSTKINYINRTTKCLKWKVCTDSPHQNKWHILFIKLLSLNNPLWTWWHQHFPDTALLTPGQEGSEQDLLHVSSLLLPVSKQMTDSCGEQTLGYTLKKKGLGVRMLKYTTNTLFSHLAPWALTEKKRGIIPERTEEHICYNNTAFFSTSFKWQARSGLTDQDQNNMARSAHQRLFLSATLPSLVHLLLSCQRCMPAPLGLRHSLSLSIQRTKPVHIEMAHI